MRGSLWKKVCCSGDIKQRDQILEETEHDVEVITNRKKEKQICYGNRVGAAVTIMLLLQNH